VVALVAISVLLSMGCVREAAKTDEPAGYTVLASDSPGEKYSVEIIADPVPFEELFTLVASVDPGLRSEMFLPDLRAEDLVVWADANTFVWCGRVVLDLDTGERRDLILPGGKVLLDYVYCPTASAFAYLVVDAGDLEVWVGGLDGSAPRAVFDQQITTFITEAAGRITCAQDGRIYFSMQRDYSTDIISLYNDETSTMIEHASNPSVSPDGRYLAYQCPGGGNAVTNVLDLATGQMVCEGLPWGLSVWASDSSLLAVQTPWQAMVFSIPDGDKVFEAEPEGQCVLTHFVDHALVYTDITRTSSVLSGASIVRKDLDSGP